ncbi:SCO3242 family prenyltransferase [Streptomyces sp. NPDC048142]|uniref:SCO3242 family prenyltransferase n=1 Tax=Streptomyces sp. NPDC048142 TaxID=3365501 RepID=UPI003710A291
MGEGRPDAGAGRGTDGGSDRGEDGVSELGADGGCDRGSDPGADGSADEGTPRERLRAWAELLRVSALFSVPGDALAGAAAVGRRPGRGTALAIGASLCLYEAGMALNDWADRDEDAVDRPHRPIPSGRISPAAALGASGVLTAAGLALAARAGRPALAVATGLAATVWAYDLRLKHTEAGPAAMAAARSLDVLLGATATATAAGVGVGVGTVAPPGTPGGGGRPGNVAGGAAPAGALPATGALPARGIPVGAIPAPARGTATSAPALGGLTACLPALPAALVLGAHTYGVTAVSRHEAQGGSTGTPLAVLATTTALAAAVLGEFRGRAPEHSGATTAHAGAGLWHTSSSGRDAVPGARTVEAGRLGRVIGLGARAQEAGFDRRAAAVGARPPEPGLPGWVAVLGAGLRDTGHSRRATVVGASSQEPGLPGRVAVLGAVLQEAGRSRRAADAAASPQPGGSRGTGRPGWTTGPTRLLLITLTGAYLRTAGPPLLHAALNPSPPLTQRAVGGGIRAMIPLQAALAVRAGAPVTGLAGMGLVPLARSLARKVSLT